MTRNWEEHKILIWGKTYPELSSSYFETVCTAGVLEDGRLIRLFPIPFRYLKDENAFKKFQWIKARIKKSESDPRPESYKIEPESIELLEFEKSDGKAWVNRANHVFKSKLHIYKTFNELFDAYKANGVSIGFIKPKSIERVFIEDRNTDDFEKFKQKELEILEKSKQVSMFNLTLTEIKQLDFLHQRFKVDWTCHDNDCKGHSMTILEWEIYVLARKVGFAKALARATELLDLSKYDIGFFLGNFRAHPNRFAIGSIWRPQKQQPTLFDL